MPSPVFKVFQPTNTNPFLTRFPVLPGRVTKLYSLLVIALGTEPAVEPVPLKETVRFHIANKVVGTVTVIESPTANEVPLRFAAVFQPAKVYPVRVIFEVAVARVEPTTILTAVGTVPAPKPFPL